MGYFVSMKELSMIICFALFASCAFVKAQQVVNQKVSRTVKIVTESGTER